MKEPGCREFPATRSSFIRHRDRTVPTIVELELGADLITTTPEHPFRVQDRGWVPAGELRPGDCVDSAAGECEPMLAIRLLDRPTLVYNFTVAEMHSYFVGEGQWWVHNAPCEGPRPVNGKNVPYPKVDVPGYGEIPFPEGPYTPNNSQSLRPRFTEAYKKQFQRWWTETMQRPWPTGGRVYIHHVKPLSWGGDNSFENLVPLLAPDHDPFTSWWRAFKG